MSGPGGIQVLASPHCVVARFDEMTNPGWFVDGATERRLEAGSERVSMQTKLVHWVAGCLLVLGAGCGAAEGSDSEQVSSVGEALAGSNAHGVLPAGLPARLGVG